ncbi:MAG TPA: hypothetical protein VGA70_01050 [Longimicrobiales bacterium]|jgi:hypothetical protein
MRWMLLFVALGAAGPAHPPVVPPVPVGARIAAAPTVLDSLVGSWSGEGTLMGRPGSFHMAWSATEVPGVHSLAFGNAFRSDDGSETPVLSAHATYRTGEDGSVDGVWFDTRGVRIELSGRVDADRLRVEWTAPTEAGVTVYGWPGNGSVDVVDSVRTAEGVREFGRASYQRLR